MAADTARKRYSVMNVFMPWRGLTFTPDVTIDQAERQALIFLYAGVLEPIVASFLAAYFRFNTLVGED